MENWFTPNYKHPLSLLAAALKIVYLIIAHLIKTSALMRKYDGLIFEQMKIFDSESEFSESQAQKPLN